jgi:hypothetical protein
LAPLVNATDQSTVAAEELPEELVLFGCGADGAVLFEGWEPEDGVPLGCPKPKVIGCSPEVEEGDEADEAGGGVCTPVAGA